MHVTRKTNNIYQQPVMLLQNTNTSAGLVNGMTGSAEEVILDQDVRGIGCPLF